jgi:uncharacterized membrane protein
MSASSPTRVAKVFLALVSTTLLLSVLPAWFLGASAASGLTGAFVVVVALGGLFALFGWANDDADRDAATPEPSVDDTDTGTDDALAELRRRYAAGELSEAQFEGRVERLLADDGGDPDDARSILELRYARGELTDEQFDRKLARLDGTRDVEDSEETFGAARTGSE